MFEKLNEKLDKKLVERELKEVQEKMQKILDAEDKERKQLAELEAKKKRQEQTYKRLCVEYAINKPASERFIALIDWIAKHPDHSVVMPPNGTIKRFSNEELFKLFRVTKLMKFLDSLDEPAQTKSD
jgi:hypothetical protein